jgi:hypothetical protein
LECKKRERREREREREREMMRNTIIQINKKTKVIPCHKQVEVSLEKKRTTRELE